MSATLVATLEIAVALLFFTNKIVLLIGKRTGWLVGVIAATLSVVYFFLLDLYIFTVLEIGLFVLMGYGYLKGKRTSAREELLVRVALTCVMGALIYFVFTGIMTVVEFFGAALMLWGTYLLTHDFVRWGWAIYGVSHCLAAAVGYWKLQPFFADFQIASAIVGVVGAIRGGNSVIRSSS